MAVKEYDCGLLNYDTIQFHRWFTTISQEHAACPWKW
jgi:hypothetical protein